MSMDKPLFQEGKDAVDASIRIIGNVVETYVVRPYDLEKMEQEEITDLPVICGTGEPKGKIGSIKGVLLDEVIRKVDVIKEQDDDTKKMYLVVSAEDGYKVVFSWQEIFNSPNGGGIMIVTEINGSKLGNGNGGFSVISVEDYFTGARFVQNVGTIEILMA